MDGVFQKNFPISLTGLLTAQEVKLLENPLKESITAQLEMNVINLFSFELNRLTLSYLQNQLNISGKMLSKNQLDFQFESNTILLGDFSFLPDLESLNGTGIIAGKIQGDLSQPQIETNLKLESVHWGSNLVDNLKGDISYQFPLLQFKNILLSNHGVQLTADGQVDLTKKYAKTS